MKNSIFALLIIVLSTFSLSAQSDACYTHQDRFVVKISPTMPLMESFGGGIEFLVNKNQAIELEASVSNLKAKSTDFIYGNTSYDYNKYHSASMRYKLYYKNDNMKKRGNTFNGAYMAPGIKGGTRANNHWEREKIGFTALTFDLGASLTFKHGIVMEAFLGTGFEATENTADLRSLNTLLRTGFRVGMAF